MTPEATQTAGPVIAPDEVLMFVAHAKRQGDRNGQVLIHPKSGRVLRIGGLGVKIVDQLEQGATLDRLTETVAGKSADAGALSKQVHDFCARLVACGFVQGYPEIPEKAEPRGVESRLLGRWLNALSAPIAAVPPVVTNVLVVLALGAAIYAVGRVMVEGALAPIQAFLTPWALVTLPALLVFVFFHEAAHGLTAGAAGVPVAGAGFIRRLIVIAPYVRTSAAYGFAPRFTQVRICLAGPMMDVVQLGAVSGALLVVEAASPAAAVLSMLFVFKGLALFGNVAPYKKSDGADALRAWFFPQDGAGARRLRGPAAKRPRRGRLIMWIFITTFVVAVLAFWGRVLFVLLSAGGVSWLRIA